MKKSAFTMLELIFVIMVIGIITAIMIPRIDRDNIFEAAQQLEAHVKLAQHLSMIDSAYNDSIPYVAGAAGSAWWYSRWAVSFDTLVTRYRVKHSSDGGFATISWVDVTNRVGGDLSDTANSTSDLLSNFNVNNVNFGGGCVGGGVDSYIVFDNIGRPYFYANSVAYRGGGSPQAGLLTTACTIQLVSSTNDATLTIEPETGYVHITTLN